MGYGLHSYSGTRLGYFSVGSGCPKFFNNSLLNGVKGSC